MTTARTNKSSELARLRVTGKLLCVVLAWLTSDTHFLGADQPAHWHHAGAMPPGAIGRQRLLRGGPLSGYCQPVEIRAPQGARIAPATANGFLEGQSQPLLVGLAIGPVYRFRVTEIPEHPGVEVFPTIEMVDRLYPPPGLELHFPVPVVLTREELLMAADGRFITRVIYLENPLLAPPIARQEDEQTWIDAGPGNDPLVMADELGRPMAILRLGGRVPEDSEFGSSFTYGGPPALILDPPPANQTEPVPGVLSSAGVAEAESTTEVSVATDQEQSVIFIAE